MAKKKRIEQYEHKGETRVAITALRFSGTLERRFEQLPSVTKALYKLGTSEPIAGCAISDFGGEFGLMALIIFESSHLGACTRADRRPKQAQDTSSICSPRRRYRDGARRHSSG